MLQVSQRVKVPFQQDTQGLVVGVARGVGYAACTLAWLDAQGVRKEVTLAEDIVLKLNQPPEPLPDYGPRALEAEHGLAEARNRIEHLEAQIQKRNKRTKKSRRR